MLISTSQVRNHCAEQIPNIAHYSLQSKAGPIQAKVQVVEVVWEGDSMHRSNDALSRKVNISCLESLSKRQAVYFTEQISHVQAAADMSF